MTCTFSFFALGRWLRWARRGLLQSPNDVAERLGAVRPPDTWAAPIALLFEAGAAGVGGPVLHRQAFIDLAGASPDPAAVQKALAP